MAGATGITGTEIGVGGHRLRRSITDPRRLRRHLRGRHRHRHSVAGDDRSALQAATLAGLRERFGLSIQLLPPIRAAGHA